MPRLWLVNKGERTSTSPLALGCPLLYSVANPASCRLPSRESVKMVVCDQGWSAEEGKYCFMSQFAPENLVSGVTGSVFKEKSECT